MPLPITISPDPPPDAPLSANPLDALHAVAEFDQSDYFLLHSGPASGYSVLAFDPLCRLLINHAGNASVDAPPALQKALPPIAPGTLPLAALQEFIAAFSFDAPHLLLGFLGFLSYDIAPFLENIPPRAPDELHWPIACFTLFRHYLIFDPAAKTTAAYTLSVAGMPPPPPPPAGPPLHIVSPPPPEVEPAALLFAQPAADYHAKIQRIKSYIAAGDIYQANLAQRWTLQTRARPHDLFRRLCAISPAPYSSCIRFTHQQVPYHVLSASPELFLAVENGRAVTRPIKGTRPRDRHNPLRDAALRDELLASAKDHAELTMIVDLLRNDLGRVSRFGTVHVAEARTIELHPTVWHTAATIRSELRPGVSLAELLAALCPGGSITGAPKIRAMQIIEEVEGFRRGLYCGNIGVIGPGSPGSRSLALNIAIRTILMRQDRAHIYAGGGIVADSDPAREYDETLHKAAAMFRALNLDPPRPAA